MKKKNGFISTSVIYSFFLVLLMLLLLIVSNLISNRLMLNDIKDTVFEDISNTNFARYIINHADSLAVEVIDNEYRYVGSSVDNYVCFSTSCSTNELYRVIGVIDGKVKLVKYTSIGDIAYNSNDITNNVFYETSMYSDYLNGTYLDSISTYADLISDTTWYIGGMESRYLTSLGNAIYEQEIGLYKQNQTISAKIGLLYISDYIAAGGSDNYGNRVSSENNWLYQSDDMWFITKVISTNYDTAFYLNTSGGLSIGSVSEVHGTYPVFFLNSNVGYISGSGTLADPFIVG